MTQSERDAAIRTLRDQLAEAQQHRVAAVTELRTWRTVCGDLAETLDAVLRDYAMQRQPPAVPSGMPSSERLAYLLDELRHANETIAECKDLLRQAGFPVT